MKVQTSLAQFRYLLVLFLFKILIFAKSYMNSFNVGSCSSTILEYGGLQIPSPWKPVLEDSSTLQIFFDYYAITKPPLSKEVCTCVCFYDCIFNV